MIESRSNSHGLVVVLHVLRPGLGHFQNLFELITYHDFEVDKSGFGVYDTVLPSVGVVLLCDLHLRKFHFYSATNAPSGGIAHPIVCSIQLEQVSTRVKFGTAEA